jgi:c-di-GMP-binding flagellar brake protein YcgR
MIDNEAAIGGRLVNADLTGPQLLWSRHQIVRLFRRFIRENRPVSAQFGDDDRLIVTRALRLNPRLDRVFFEYGDHKDSNSVLLRSQNVLFSVEEGRSKAQFTSPRVRDVLLDGRPVFHIPIPARVVQVDRRVHNRIQVPRITAPAVVFYLPDGRKAEGRLADLSAGGIGVVGLASDLNVRTGTVIRHCLIELSNRKRVYVDLQIRYLGSVVDSSGKPTHRVGFSLESQPKEFAELLNAFTVDL